MAAAAIRTIFAQPDATRVQEQLDVIAGMLGRQLPKVETMLRDAAEDLLAFTAFPVGHWKKIWSTNPLERLNKEIKSRTDEPAEPDRGFYTTLRTVTFMDLLCRYPGTRHVVSACRADLRVLHVPHPHHCP
jgi:hypothetical protein